MKLTEMFDRVIFKSGQFIMAKSKLEVDPDSFRFLIEDSLAIYSKTHPKYLSKNLEIISPRQVDFDVYPPTEYGVPDWISEVTPVKFSGLSINAFNVSGYKQNGSTLIDPLEAPWDYSKPLLTVPFASKYKVTMCYKHRLTELDGSYEVKTITYEDHLFFDLLQGLFLQGIGRSRRSFTLNDLPITMDADAIASEGKEIVETTIEKLGQSSRFFLAMG